MRRTRDLALFYLAAAISGLAAAYILRQVRLYTHHIHQRSISHKWAHPRPLPNDRKPKPSSDDDPPSTATKSLPPIRTHALPPPLPNAHALLSESFVSIDTTLGAEEQTNTTSDSDSFIDLLSPAPTNASVVSRRRSMRAVHDLFAESHISFAELGSLVAPQDEPN